MVKTNTKGYKGFGMEGFIARYYDKNSRIMMDQYSGWAKIVSKIAKDGDKIVEVAPGPGYLAIELSRLGKYDIAGLDISHSFVRIARDNAREAGVSIDFRQGNAAEMPFADSTFDLVICTSAFKNFKEPVKALREMRRVLKPGGTAWISDLRHDVSDETIDRIVKNNMKARGLNALFAKWTFKYSLKKRAYTKAQFIDFISKAGFKNYEIKENPEDLEIRLQNK